MPKKCKIAKIIFVRHGESTENLACDLGTTYDPNNIILTDKGAKQAETTGKYLSTICKKFDCVILSPIVRCRQTSDIIMNEIGFDPSKLIIDDNIIEGGSIRHPFAGLGKEERNKLIESDIKGKSMEKEINLTTNPFKKYLLNKKYYRHIAKTFKYKPDFYEVEENLKKFLKKLEDLIKENNRKILVISHGGVINCLQKMLCRIQVHQEIFISEKAFSSPGELLGNCACMYVKYKDDKFSIVSPANTYHLNNNNI